jgi:hypothetical protein
LHFFALSISTSLKILGAVIPRRVFTHPGLGGLAEFERALIVARTASSSVGRARSRRTNAKRPRFDQRTTIIAGAFFRPFRAAPMSGGTGPTRLRTLVGTTNIAQETVLQGCQHLIFVGDLVLGAGGKGPRIEGRLRRANP